MFVSIAHQKATAIAKKYFNGEMPNKSHHPDGFVLPSGAKLRWASYERTWGITCYTYDPARLELAPLNIKVQNNE